MGVGIATEPESRRSAAYALTAPAVRMAGSILVGLAAGLVLQAWTVAFLGRLGSEALYIRSVYTPVGYLTLAVTEGLVVAAQVSAGRAARDGRHSEALRSVPTFIAAGGGLLLLQAAVVAVVPGPMLAALGVAPREQQPVVVFIVATAVSSAVGLIPYLGAGVLRGLGHTGAAAWLGVTFTALSIAGTAVVHWSTGLGVLAVPIGGLPATALVGAATAMVLKRKGLGWPTLRGDRQAAGEVWRLGAPVAATFMLLSTATFGYLTVLQSAGPTEVAGFSLGQMATSLVMVIALAVGSGAAIAVTLRPDADRQGANLAGLTATLRLSLPPYLVIGASVFLFRDAIAGALTSDQPTAAVTAEYFAWTGPTLALFGGTLALLTYLEQIGRAGVAFTLNATYFALMVTAAFLIPGQATSGDLARLIAAGNVLCFISLWFSARFLIRRGGGR